MPEPRPAFRPDDKAGRDERLHQFAHALKNRMGALWQAAVMLHDLPEGPERRQLLELAERNYFGGAGELEHLLDDFGVARGVAQLSPEPVDLAGLVEECIRNNAFRTVKKEQQAIFRPEGRPMVQADRNVMRQLLEALLSNASKFTPAGGCIEATLAEGPDSIEVTVKDNGVGLSAEDLAQVFRRYALLGSRSTAGESQARSTLARAKQWAEAHGGTLQAESAGTGKGCTFTLRLPKA
jgi:signal transduction histidine kinase